MDSDDKLASSPEFLALSSKQRAFVFAYLKSENGTRSYMEAYGQTDETMAAIAASKLIRSNKVSKALNLAKIATGKRIERKFSISRDKLLRILAQQALFDPSEVVEIDEEGVRLKKPKNMKAIKSFSYSSSSSSEGSSESFSFSVHDKVKAAEVLAKMTGALDAEPTDDTRRVSNVHGRAAELVRRRRAK